MAKDSDKRAVVAKRRIELLHAINHEYSEDKVILRVEKLRFAILKLIKKEFDRLGAGVPDGLIEKWNAIATDEIIDIAIAWPEKPSIRNVIDAVK